MQDRNPGGLFDAKKLNAIGETFPGRQKAGGFFDKVRIGTDENGNVRRMAEKF